MKKLFCFLSTIIFLFTFQLTGFAHFSENNIQAESKYTFKDGANVIDSSFFDISLVALKDKNKGKGKNKNENKYSLNIRIKPNNWHIKDVNHFNKYPIKLSFLKNNKLKTIKLKIHKNHIMLKTNNINIKYFLNKDNHKSIKDMTDLSIMIPSANGKYKTLKLPKNIIKEWNQVLNVI